MKTIPIALATAYAASAQSIVSCLKVTRSDGVVVGFTEHDKALTVSGVSYVPGFDPSALASTDTLSVDNMELTFLALDADLPEADLLSGKWDNAAFEIFECNWKSLTDGVNVLKRGTTGEVQVREGRYTVEFRSLTQSLQQTQGIVTNKTCRDRLGGPHCTLDLTPFTFTGTLTAVTSARSFTDSAKAQAADYFTEGEITFTSGPASGFTQKIKRHSTGGVFLLSLPLPYTPVVGNAYSIVAGCQKRLEEDCATKFSNVLNFWGEPHLPGLDKLTGKGTATNVQPDTTPEYSTDTPGYPGGT